MRGSLRWRKTLVLLLGCILWSGCQSAKPPGDEASPRARSRSQRAMEADDEAALEKRVEAHARYATAVVQDLNDETEAAVDNYHRAALLDYRDEQLVLDVSRRLLQLKEADKALDILQKSAADPNASAAVFTRLAAVYSFLTQTNKAVEAARTAIRKNPQSLASYQQLAQIYLHQGDYPAALQTLRQAAEQAKIEPEGLVTLAELCLGFVPSRTEDKQELRELGLQLLERAAQSKTTNPLLLQRMADAFLFLGKVEQASGLYLQMLERFPQLPGLRERLVDLYLRQQDTAKASNQLEAVVRDNPTNFRAHYLLGSLCYEGRAMEKARDHFRKVIILNPEFEQVYYDLAGALINLNQPEQALETLETARGKHPLRFITELYSALAYSRLKNYSKAVKHFEAAEIIARAAETNRLTHVLFFQIGAAYERNKQYQEAERYFRKCLEMAPEFPEGLNYLGYMWAERGENLEEARELIEKAVKLEPKNAAYLDSLGWVWFKLNQPDKALPHLQRAIELADEPDPVLYDHLGDVHAALHDLPKARDAWKRSLELEPNPAIEEKLKSPTPHPQEPPSSEKATAAEKRPSP